MLYYSFTDLTDSSGITLTLHGISSIIYIVYSIYKDRKTLSIILVVVLLFFFFFGEQYNFIKWKLLGRLPEILSFFFSLHEGIGKSLALSWGHRKYCSSEYKQVLIGWLLHCGHYLGMVLDYHLIFIGSNLKIPFSVGGKIMLLL